MMTGRTMLYTLMLGMLAPGLAMADEAMVASKGVSVLGLLSLPQGDFADEKFFEKESDGAAGKGIGLGVEYVRPMQLKNMQMIFGAYFIRNPMDLDDYERSGTDGSVSIKAGPWANISAMGGVRMLDVAGIQDFYVQGMAGFNRISMDDIDVAVRAYDYYYDEYYDETFTYSAPPEITFAFSIGAGKKVGRWDVGLRYMNFGEPKLELEERTGSGSTDEVEKELKVSLLAVTVGYSF